MLTLEDLAHLAQAHSESLRAAPAHLTLHGRRFSLDERPAIMGVINFSPDSWYRESVCTNLEMALKRCRLLRTQGADLIDLGTESTLPQADRADAAKQQGLLLPLLEQMQPEGLLFSVETYLPEVADQALSAGAAVINFTGSAGAEEMFRVVAQHQAAVILCFVQGANVREVADFEPGEDPITTMLDYFGPQIESARACGVRQIIIDPGLGFYYRNLPDGADRVRLQMQVFLNSFRLRRLGVPICHALPHAFEFFGEEVRSAEPFFAVMAALGGTHLFRTHEAARVKAVLDTMNCW